jgi:hypothetical protein
LASWIAARSEQSPTVALHTPLPTLASLASTVLLTTRVVVSA